MKYEQDTSVCMCCTMTFEKKKTSTHKFSYSFNT